MAVSKVILNGDTLIDVTVDTVTSEKLLSGYQATGRDGVKVQGSYVPATVSLTNGSADPSESSQHITPPSGYDGFSYFDIGAIDSDYVGSGIARKSSADLTASGSVVSVPSGYYSIAASTSIPSGSATTPTKTISVTPSISINSSTGVITATAAGSSSITPTVSAGYVSSGTVGTVSVSGSNTSALSTQGTTTITPTESVQTAVASGKFTVGKVQVDAISSTYVGSGVTQRSSEDLIASGSVISVPSGYYAVDVSKSIQSGSATTPSVTIIATPSITISDDGKINVTIADSSNISPTIVAGYISQGTAGTIIVSGSGTKGMGTYGATTITPGTSTYALQSRNYLTGLITIQGDSDLVSSNIKDNVKIFDVTGTFTDSSTVSTGQTAASSSEIMQGYSAWVDGQEVKGTMATTSIVEGITTVSGSTATRGIAEWSSGNIASGYMNAATFANSSSAQTQYVDISNTTDAPVLVSGGYLYINKGYTDDLKISLAKLVPDGASADLASDKILSGYAAYNNDGTLIAGNIPTKNSTDVTASGSTVSIPSGYYSSAVSKNIASGSVKVNNTDLVRTPGLTLDNTVGIVTATIPYAQTNVGAALSTGYISTVASGSIGVTGSSSLQLAIAYGSTITPTESSQIAVASGNYTLGNITVAAISSNYVGSAIAQRSTGDLTATGSVINVPSGYYSTAVSTAIKGGAVSAVAMPSFIPEFSVNNDGIVTVTQNTVTSVLPTLTSGYIDTVSPFTVVVAGTSNYQLPVITTTTIDQIVSS